MASIPIQKEIIGCITTGEFIATASSSLFITKVS